MAEHESVPYFREIVLFLTFAGVLIPLLGKLKVNQVLGFLAAGVLVGPYGAARLADDWPWMAWLTFPRPESVAQLAELGVVFLMFTIGLELSIQRLVALRHWVFGVGLLQMALTAICVFLLSMLFDFDGLSAVMIGLVLSFSSTAVVMQLLRQRNELASPMGRGVFSVLLMQDLAVVPLLLFVGALGVGVTENSNVWLELGWALGKAALAATLIYLIARKVLGPLFYWLDSQGSADTFMALTLLATLGIAAATWLAGLSMAMGALLAGILLAETEFRHRVSLTIEPFTGLLLGLFFMSVGMGIDLIQLTNVFVPLTGLAVLLMVAKSIIAAFALRVGGLRWPLAIEGGMMLGQGGEFAFVLLGPVLLAGLVSVEFAQVLSLLVGITMFLTPIYSRLALSIGQWLQQKLPAQDAACLLTQDASSKKGHVIIVGFGRVGQSVAAALDSQDIDTVVIERYPSVVQQWAGKRAIYVGDVSRPEILHHLGMERASAVVLTMDQSTMSIGALRAIRAAYPRMPVIARARDETHAMALKKSGACAVVPETLEASLQLSGLTLSAVGVPEDGVQQWVANQRELRQSIFKT
jgi:monovalent cation:H+ antiporter-2, CPA2 family